MNDYLTRLAARALAPLPAIHPRPGSRFEPATPPLGSQAVWPARQIALTHDETLEVESGRLNRLERRPLLLAPPRSQAAPLDRRDDELPSNGFAPSAPAVQPHSAPTQSPAVTVSAISAPAPPATMQIAPAKTPAASAEAGQQLVRDSHSQTDEAQGDLLRPASPPHRSELLRELNRTEAVASDNLGNPAARLADESPPGRQLAVPAVVAVPIARSESAASQHLLPHEPAVPTVRVTIGRIDVRAIAPPAAPTAPSRATSVAARLSLEDYLNRRSGDRR